MEGCETGRTEKAMMEIAIEEYTDLIDELEALRAYSNIARIIFVLMILILIPMIIYTLKYRMDRELKAKLKAISKAEGKRLEVYIDHILELYVEAYSKTHCIEWDEISQTWKHVDRESEKLKYQLELKKRGPTYEEWKAAKLAAEKEKK